MDFNRQPQDYDRIITGDLGYVGQTILLELLKEKGFDIKSSIWTAESKFMTVSYRITFWRKRLWMFRSDAFRHDTSGK